uniref:t-SNARE coiled-coil homology domain-containing protein n=1 Tax=Loa loa TaxID=7209 RepID=A0A1I7VB26_LOALO
MDLTPPDQHLAVEEKQQQFELKRRTIEQKIRRLKPYDGTLRSVNEKMVGKRKQEEDKYADMVDDNKGLLNLINDGQEAVITLDMYKDEFEVAVQRLQQSKVNNVPFQQKELSLSRQ